MDSTKLCIESLKKASNDNELIAALALIPKIGSYEQVDKIAAEIPEDFIRRLLESDSADMRELGVNVLSAVLNGKDTIQLATKFSCCTKNLIKCCDSKNKLDVLDLLSQLATKECSEPFWELFLSPGFTNNESIKDMKFIAMVLNVGEYLLNCDANLQKWDSFMQTIVDLILCSKDPLSHEIFSLINAHLENLFFVISNLTYPKWSAELRTFLRNILVGHRKEPAMVTSVMRLCHTLFDIYGFAWISPEDNFLDLLTRLTDVELRIAIDKPMEQISCDDYGIVLSCTKFMERAVHVCESENSAVPDSSALTVCSTMQQTTTFALHYFIQANQMQLEIPLEVSVPLHRMCCSFFATGATEIIDGSVLKQAIPIIVQLCCHCVRVGGVDQTVALFLPAISHLPTQLISEAMLNLLLDYLKVLWVKMCKRTIDEESLCTPLSVLINMPTESWTEKIKNDFLMFLIKRLTSKELKDEANVTLGMYTATLVLHLINLTEEKTILDKYLVGLKDCLIIFDKFMRKMGVRKDSSDEDLEIFRFGIERGRAILMENNGKIKAAVLKCDPKIFDGDKFCSPPHHTQFDDDLMQAIERLHKII